MIGIGIDLVDIDRFRRSLERTPSLRDRLFRPDERTYADSHVDPAGRYAVRFAAKEAALKALGLGLGGMAMHDIEVCVTAWVHLPSCCTTRPSRWPGWPA